MHRIAEATFYIMPPQILAVVPDATMKMRRTGPYTSHVEFGLCFVYDGGTLVAHSGVACAMMHSRDACLLDSDT